MATGERSDLTCDFGGVSAIVVERIIGMSGDDELGTAVERTSTRAPVVGVIEDATLARGIEQREVIDPNEPRGVLVGIGRAQTQRLCPEEGQVNLKLCFAKAELSCEAGLGVFVHTVVELALDFSKPPRVLLALVQKPNLVSISG